MMNIVILDAGTLGKDMDLSLFDKLGNCTVWDQTDPEDVTARASEADVIISNRIALGKNVLIQLPRLKMIALTATGFNTVNTDYCREKGIALANVAGYSTDSVAQHTITILLYLMGHTRYYDDYVRQEKYLEDKRFAEVSRPWSEICGKTWGIIGMGAIGRKVAAIASAFGASVCYASTSGAKREEKWPQVPLEELLAKSDIVSIHAPLNDKTRDLISFEQFALMKKSAILINVGRGPIIHEPALEQALESGQIAAACLDVLAEEPPAKDYPLLRFTEEDKLLITPHNAWTSREARIRLINEVFENIKAFTEGIQRNRIV